MNINPVKKVDGTWKKCSPEEAQSWVAFWREAGKLTRKFFPSQTAADRHLAGIRSERRKFGTALQLPSADRQEVAECIRLLEPFGATIRQATDFYIRNRPKVAEAGKTIEDAIKACVATKNASGKRISYCQQLTVVLNQFARTVPGKPISEIGTRDVEAWVYGGEYSPKTRRNRQVDLSTLFNFAIKRGWVSDNPVAAMERIEADDPPVSIWTPEQYRTLLNSAREKQPRSVPFIAMQLFGGLRRSEARQVVPADVNGTVITVNAKSAKKRQRRLIDINPTLKAWMDLGGDLPPSRDMSEIGHLVSCEWPRNVLRHGFISYHLAAHRNAPETALQAGTSPDMVFRHYRELVTREAAEEFWRIMP